MTTIFFVHGMWTTPRIWESYRSYFEELGYRTVAPALPQHFSRNQAQHVEGLSLRDYVDQIEEDYRALEKSGSEIVVVGHGMGCVLSMQLAMRVEPSALIMLNPEMPAGMATTIPSLRALSEAILTPFFWRRGIKPEPKAASEFLFNALPSEKANEYYDYLCFESGQVLHELWFWFADPGRASRIEREKITCPILTLAGNKDQICSSRNARRLSRHLGQGRHFHCLPGFGHMLPLEDQGYEAARQMHVWLCWQLGLRKPSVQAEGLNTATV